MYLAQRVTGLGPQIGLNIVLDFSEPAVWWYVTRASAIVAWILLTFSVLWGILLKTRILRGADNPEWLKVIHRFMSGLAMVMVITHMVSLYLDSYIEFTVADLLIPFSSSFEPLGVALGVIGMWVMVVVWATSMVMQWIPQPVWKAIHYLSYLSLFAVALHSGMVGSDVGTPWYTALSLGLIVAASLAAIIRIILTKRSPGSPKALPTASGQASATPATQSAPSAPVSTASGSQQFIARVLSRRVVARDVVEITFGPIDDAAELEWEPGAHITVHLGNGLERQYSLVGDPADARALTIAVLDTGGPGGGSQWIHKNLTVGMELSLEGPLQAFPLKAHHRYQFIASGIGITPIRSMLGSLPANRDWELVYLGRTREEMAYVDELEASYPDRVRVWASQERGKRANLSKLVDTTAHVYACGSEALLADLEARVPSSQLHLERFTPVDRSNEHSATAFTVTWAPTGAEIAVGPETTVLEGLESAGIDVNASCRRGVCGSCELSVLAGEAAHLDSVMSDADKDELGIMYPCVSRSTTATLTVGPS